MSPAPGERWRPTGRRSKRSLPRHRGPGRGGRAEASRAALARKIAEAGGLREYALQQLPRFLGVEADASNLAARALSVGKQRVSKGRAASPFPCVGFPMQFFSGSGLS